MGTSYSVVVTGRDLQDLAEQINAKFNALDEDIRSLKEQISRPEKPKPAVSKKKTT